MTTIERVRAGETVALALERGAMATLTLLALTFAFESVRPLLSLGPVVLTNVEALLFVTVGLWAAWCVTARRLPATPRAVALPAATWLGVLLLSALLAPAHRTDAIKFVGRMAGAVLVAWAAYDLSQVRSRWAILLRALAVGGLLVTLFGLAEMLDLPGIDGFLAGFKEGPTVVGEVLRVSSTLAYATIASMVLELSVPLLLAWTLTARRRMARGVLAAGLAATLAAQALTLTRAGLIALLAALGAMAVWAAWRRRRPVLVGSLAAGAVLLALWGALLIWNPVVRYRFVSETEHGWYQAAYKAPAHLTLAPGGRADVVVTVTNNGARAWKASGEHAFGLGYHLTLPEGTMVQFDGGHFALSHDVPPGSTVRVEAPVMVPATIDEGEYVIEWDMVHEGVTWFKWEGTQPLQTRLTVGGAGSTVDASPTIRPEPSPPRSLSAGEQGRLWLWRVAADMVLDRPLLGVGPDNFRWLQAAYAGLDEVDSRVHANNLYIEWLADTGIVGFAAFLWLMVSLAGAVWAALVQRRAEPAGSTASGQRLWAVEVWLLATSASLVAWFAHGTLDFFYEFTPTYLAFALLCGLALAGSSLLTQEGLTCASDST